MRRLPLLSCLTALACAGSTKTTHERESTRGNPTDSKGALEGGGDSDGAPPVVRGEAGCRVRAHIPSEATEGSYPSIEVEVDPAIDYYGGDSRPMMEIAVTKPSGERETTLVELLYLPVCAYCLPAKGSSGCDHDCEWEPFVGDSYGISRMLGGPGEYPVELRLANLACALEGGSGVLTIIPRP